MEETLQDLRTRYYDTDLAGQWEVVKELHSTARDNDLENDRLRKEVRTLRDQLSAAKVELEQAHSLIEAYRCIVLP